MGIDEENGYLQERGMHMNKGLSIRLLCRIKMLPVIGHGLPRNLASMRGDGKCRVDAHEIHTCLYNMTKT